MAQRDFSNNWWVCSDWPLVCRWKAVEHFSVMPSAAAASVHSLDWNWPLGQRLCPWGRAMLPDNIVKELLVQLRCHVGGAHGDEVGHLGEPVHQNQDHVEAVGHWEWAKVVPGQ